MVNIRKAQLNKKIKNKKGEKLKMVAIYTEDKQVILNHLKQASARLMKAKYDGSAKHAMSCLQMATELEAIESEPKPEPKVRDNKSKK